jgi:hypothetical protein
MNAPAGRWSGIAIADRAAIAGSGRPAQKLTERMKDVW